MLQRNMTRPAVATPVRERPPIVVLQAFRGIAAAIVVVFHVSHSIFSLPKYWTVRPFGDVFEFGHAGVEFFFVLSGFIILFVHRGDLGRPARLAGFAWKRFRRIYPVYWVVLALTIPVFVLLPSAGTGTERLPATWLDSLLLIHLLRIGDQVVSVSWTLFHEILFYAMFALVILHRSWGAVAFGLWMAGSVALLLNGGGNTEFAARVGFALSPLHLLFAMGMAAAWAVRRGPVPVPLGLTLGGVALFAATAAVEISGAGPNGVATFGTRGSFLQPEAFSVFYGLGSALLVVGAVTLERAGRLRVPSWLAFLGDASYSVYLVHIVALSIAAKLFRAAVDQGVPLPPALVFVVLSALGIAAGLVFHVVVERRLLAWLPTALQRTAPGSAR